MNRKTRPRENVTIGEQLHGKFIQSLTSLSWIGDATQLRR
jgi:hypothetical protein